MSSVTLRREEASETDENKTWDPGGDPRETNSIKIKVTGRLYSLICDLNGAEDTSEDQGPTTGTPESRTELDSHANMPVIGRHSYIISNTGKIADVNAFSPDHKTMQITIVDAAVKYECPYDQTVYILVIRNALHVPSMDHNLIPPFMMREAGIEVHDTPKIQVLNPTEEDHSIYFPETRFRIPLSL